MIVLFVENDFRRDSLQMQPVAMERQRYKPFAFLPIHLCAFLPGSDYLAQYQFACPPMYQLICLSIHRFIHPSIDPPK